MSLEDTYVEEKACGTGSYPNVGLGNVNGIHVGIVLPEHPSAGDQSDMECHMQSLKTLKLGLLFPVANMEMCSHEARKQIQDW